MKVYLAGPMKGVPQFNFPAFMEAAQKLREQGMEVFNPAEKDIDLYGAEPFLKNQTGSLVQAAKEVSFDLRKTFSADLKYICEEAEAIAMLPGWEMSTGATIERSVAKFLGIDVIYLAGPKPNKDRTVE